MKERARLFGKSGSLVGIVTYPENSEECKGKPALLLLNAGLVHHAGPNRLYTRLARHMAAQGFLVVRFDFSGNGDSPIRADRLPFMEAAIQETAEVMDDITATEDIDHFCLMGISSGALVSLRTALQDSRVKGVGILNPHGFDNSSQWRTHINNMTSGRMYKQNLFRPQSWYKALTGQTNYRRLGKALWYGIAHKLSRSKTVSNIADGVQVELKKFLTIDASILLLFSEADRSIENFNEILGRQWQQELPDNVSKRLISDANHTFSNPVHQNQVLHATQEWMTDIWPT